MRMKALDAADGDVIFIAMDNAEQQIRALFLDAQRKQAIARDKAAAFAREADMHGVAADAFKTALAAFAAPAASTPSPSFIAPLGQASSTAGGAIPGGAKWLNIYSQLARSFQPPFSYADIERASTECGYEVNVSAMRTQMMHAVNAGIFERVGAGRFTMTDVGLDLVTDPKENGSPKGDPEAGEVHASPEVPSRDAHREPTSLFPNP